MSGTTKPYASTWSIFAEACAKSVKILTAFRGKEITYCRSATIAKIMMLNDHSLLPLLYLF